jgi:hypothetical protein
VVPALTANAYYNARMSIRSRARALARYVAVERGVGFRWYKRFVSEMRASTQSTCAVTAASTRWAAT